MYDNDITLCVGLFENVCVHMKEMVCGFTRFPNNIFDGEGGATVLTDILKKFRNGLRGMSQ